MLLEILFAGHVSCRQTWRIYAVRCVSFPLAGAAFPFYSEVSSARLALNRCSYVVFQEPIRTDGQIRRKTAKSMLPFAKHIGKQNSHVGARFVLPGSYRISRPLSAVVVDSDRVCQNRTTGRRATIGAPRGCQVLRE